MMFIPENLAKLEGALCANPRYDPDYWFHEDEDSIRQAKGVCNICPVRKACLEISYQEDEAADYKAWGVRGGRTQRQRQKVLDLRKIKAGIEDENV